MHGGIKLTKFDLACLSDELDALYSPTSTTAFIYYFLNLSFSFLNAILTKIFFMQENSTSITKKKNSMYIFYLLKLVIHILELFKITVLSFYLFVFFTFYKLFLTVEI